MNYSGFSYINLLPWHLEVNKYLNSKTIDREAFFSNICLNENAQENSPAFNKLDEPWLAVAG